MTPHAVIARDPDTDMAIRIPELRSGKVPVPYVKSKEGVAHADLGGSRIEGERSFSGASRRIEDPFGRKKNEVRVCVLCISHLLLRR